MLINKPAVVVYFLLVFLLGSWADAQRRGQHYVLVVPAADLRYEGRNRLGVNSIFALETRSARSDSDPGALPFPLEMRFWKKRGREVEFRGLPGARLWLKLRFADAADLERRWRQYAASPLRGDQLLASFLDRVAASVFDASTVPASSRRSLVRYAFGIGAAALRPPVRFRDLDYLPILLGTDPTVYDTNETNQNQRLARVLADLFPRLVAAPALEAARLGGFRVDVDIPYGRCKPTGHSTTFWSSQNWPVSGYSWGYAVHMGHCVWSGGTDSLTLYVDAVSLGSLRHLELTSQELVDRSVVVVNGTRVQVDLLDQGRG